MRASSCSKATNALYYKHLSLIHISQTPLRRKRQQKGKPSLPCRTSSSPPQTPSRTCLLYTSSVRMAGDMFDQAIIAFIKRKYNLLIGERTAEQIKIEIGSAYALDPEMCIRDR